MGRWAKYNHPYSCINYQLYTKEFNFSIISVRLFEAAGIKDNYPYKDDKEMGGWQQRGLVPSHPITSHLNYLGLFSWSSQK